MRREIEDYNMLFRKEARIVGCCCGHGKYPKTIIIRVDSPLMGKFTFELFSRKNLLARKRFYRRDKEGHYYIPEVCEAR
jgi:hypothetical protein